jgi:poly(A) polymerase
VASDPPPDPLDARAAALEVAATLHARGHEALFCGGAVRDRLLGRTPGDYDVATSAPPEVVAPLFPRAILVGAQFGTVVVPVRGHPIQVTTFRADGLYIDGRRPTGVVFSDAATDAQRRDFTVNGLFEDPRTGEVIDHVGGRRDLEARLLRAIGDPAARFEEDHLRLLRCVRQAIQLGFAIEPLTLRALRELAPRVASVAAERIRVELVKLLKAGRGKALRALRDAGLLPHVLPEIEVMQGVTQPPRYHPEGDVFVHTALVLDNLPLDGLDAEQAEDLVWAALLHDVSKPATRSVGPDGRIRFHGHESAGREASGSLLERLKCSRRTIDRVGDLVGTHMQFPSLPQMRAAKLRRFLAQPDIDLHMRLHGADCGASHGDLSLLEFCRTQLADLGETRALPPPLVTGHDLIAMGVPPGPAMGETLGWIRDLQLEGAVTTKEEAVRRVRERVVPPARGA